MRTFILVVILLLAGCAGVNKQNNVKTIEMPLGLNLTVNDIVAAMFAHIPILQKGDSRAELISQLSEEHKKDIIRNTESEVVLFNKGDNR